MPEWRERRSTSHPWLVKPCSAIRGRTSLCIYRHTISIWPLSDWDRFSNFLPKSQNQLRLCARCQPPGYETPFGWAVHLKMGARVWIFDIRTNGNMLKIVMCCIINIQPDDLSEVSSAMLHYINHFVNYQTDNADYYSKYVCLKA